MRILLQRGQENSQIKLKIKDKEFRERGFWQRGQDGEGLEGRAGSLEIRRPKVAGTIQYGMGLPALPRAFSLNPLKAKKPYSIGLFGNTVDTLLRFFTLHKLLLNIVIIR